MKNYCDKCEKPIKIHEHFFTVTSNNPESFKSYDTVKKEYHEHCIKGVDLTKEFEWHIKGEY